MRRVFVGLLLLPAVVLAQSSGGPFVMRKEVIGAGQRASGGNFTLTGTLAQPAAAVQTAGIYRLTGGFHAAAPDLADRLLCDGFEDSPCP